MLAIARLNPIATLPGWGAMASATLAASGVVACPQAWLAEGVQAVGIAALSALVEPVVDAPARAVLAAIGGLLCGAIGWVAFKGAEGLLTPAAILQDGARAVRRADAHPDAPPRRPLSAAELIAPRPARGTATFRASESPLAPGERLRTFALAVPASATPDASEAAGIDTLLRRLEQDAGRRAA